MQRVGAGGSSPPRKEILSMSGGLDPSPPPIFWEQLSRLENLDFLYREHDPLRDAWAAAWLREYQCHTRYLALLAMDNAEDRELRLAWLHWWHAARACREALAHLEGVEST